MSASTPPGAHEKPEPGPGDGNSDRAQPYDEEPEVVESVEAADRANGEPAALEEK